MWFRIFFPIPQSFLFCCFWVHCRDGSLLPEILLALILTPSPNINSLGFEPSVLILFSVDSPWVEVQFWKGILACCLWGFLWPRVILPLGAHTGLWHSLALRGVKHSRCCLLPHTGPLSFPVSSCRLLRVSPVLTSSGTHFFPLLLCRVWPTEGSRLLLEIWGF